MTSPTLLMLHTLSRKSAQRPVFRVRREMDRVTSSVMLSPVFMTRVIVTISPPRSYRDYYQKFAPLVAIQSILEMAFATSTATRRPANMMAEIVSSSSYCLWVRQFLDGDNVMGIRIHGKSTLASAVMLLSFLSPVLVQAACSQSDLKGTWFTYSLSVDSFVTEDHSLTVSSMTNRCKVKVSSSGDIVASKSSCKFRDQVGKDPLNITSGDIKVNPKCKLKGSITMELFGTSSITLILESGALAKDKTTFSAVGYSEVEPDVITHMTAVKQ